VRIRTEAWERKHAIRSIQMNNLTLDDGAHMAILAGKDNMAQIKQSA